MTYARSLIGGDWAWRAARGRASVAFFVAALGLVGAQAARADITFHNGFSAPPSHPTGTDEVDVAFVVTSIAPGLLAVGLGYEENARHLFGYSYEATEPPVLFIEFALANSTGLAWTDFNIELFGADFFGIDEGPPVGVGDLARAEDPVVIGTGLDLISFSPGSGSTVSVAGSQIVRDGDNAFLSIQFDEFVDPGELFSLAFFIDDVGDPDLGFAMGQTPVPIPAPGAAVLGLLGFGVFGWVRRRIT